MHGGPDPDPLQRGAVQESSVLHRCVQATRKHPCALQLTDPSRKTPRNAPS